MYKNHPNFKTNMNKYKDTTYIQVLVSLLAIFIYSTCYWRTRQRSWLKHYATNPKVAGSIPDEVIGLFN
jgi:hypothetical protein